MENLFLHESCRQAGESAKQYPWNIEASILISIGILNKLTYLDYSFSLGGLCHHFDLVRLGCDVISDSRSNSPPIESLPRMYNVVGKDILKFHSIYWPAFLLAIGLSPPARVIAHAHWTVERQKMSKSRGNVVCPFHLADRFGVDPVRLYLLKSGGLIDDGDFSEAELVRHVNSDIAGEQRMQSCFNLLKSEFLRVPFSPPNSSFFDVSSCIVVGFGGIFIFHSS